MKLEVEQLSTLRASDLLALREPIDVVRDEEVIARIVPAPLPRQPRPAAKLADPARAEAMRQLSERLSAMPRFELTEKERRDIEALVGPLDLD